MAQGNILTQTGNYQEDEEKRKRKKIRKCFAHNVVTEIKVGSDE
jgi:hypothetical protein